MVLHFIFEAATPIRVGFDWPERYGTLRLFAAKLELRVRLTPKHPPGRADRKAGGFEPEIVRLRSEGYTCEAIRQALADIGVDVSLSTVQREAGRCSRRRPPVVLRSANLAPSAAVPAPATFPAPAGLATDPRSGKEIAASFVSNRITNPLFRARSANESSRH